MNPERKPLDSLLKEAGNYSEFFLKDSGHIKPVYMCITGEDILQMFQYPFEFNEQGKDDFENICRVMTIALEAKAYVVAVEMWVVLANTFKINYRPSEHPDRQEMIMMVGQDTEQHAQRLFEITRISQGRFWSLNEFRMDGFVSGENGRFRGYMPIKPITPDVKQAAKVALELRGIGFKMIDKK